MLFGSYPKRYEPFEWTNKLEYTYYEVLSVDDKNVNVFMIYDRSEAEAVAEILRVNAFTKSRSILKVLRQKKLPTIKNESKNVSAVLKNKTLN